MRIGIFASPEMLQEVVSAKADYIECSVVGLNALSDSRLDDFKQDLSSKGMGCEACAVLLPGADIPVTGDSADHQALKKYAEIAFYKINKAFSPSVIVFGSGRARRRPDGYSRDKTLSQMAEACRVVATAAEPYGITIAVEPLNKGECNILNTIPEAVCVAKQAGLRNVKIIADIYHMLADGEPADDLRLCEGLLAHTHVAAKKDRLPPQEADWDQLKPYFDTLRGIGYDGRMTIEANIDRADTGSLAASVSLLRRI